MKLLLSLDVIRQRSVVLIHFKISLYAAPLRNAYTKILLVSCYSTVTDHYHGSLCSFMLFYIHRFGCSIITLLCVT